MYNCKNLYYLSSIACMLADCMDESELEVLSADLRTLGEMIDSITVRQSCCEKNERHAHHDPAD